MALIRREELLAVGGYTTDARLTGWEDFHLWCRCAEGRYGVIVPQVLAWYRRQAHFDAGRHREQHRRGLVDHARTIPRAARRVTASGCRWSRVSWS